MFVAALFIIAKVWNPTRCPSTNEWVKCHTNTMECVIYRTMNEIMSFTGPWMELISLMFSKINQAEKDKYHMFYLTYGIQS
jgi:hypothetical protein